MADLLKNILQTRPMGQVLLGLDVGKKTIGVAVSDDAHRMAMPLKTITRTKFGKDVSALCAIITEYQVGGLVLGYPVNMDGSEGARCQSIRDFATELERQLPADILGDAPWIALHDERLSTSCVEDFVGESVGISKRKAKDRGIIDKLAAQVILQGALDCIDRA